MQVNEWGEFIPTKELRTNFKIPKKAVQEADTALYRTNGTQQDGKNQDNAVVQNTGSYYDYYSCYLNLPTTVATPALPTPAANETVPQCVPQMKARTTNDVNSSTNKPKFSELIDTTLPQELIDLFTQTNCNLCNAQLSSYSVAKLHYQSKNHAKNSRKYLVEYASRTGTPLHPSAATVKSSGSGGATIAAATPGGAGTAEKDAANPLHYYCKVCDLKLTGKIHAESHYSGKPHRKAMIASINQNGEVATKWRKPPKRSFSDGFGDEFQTKKLKIPPSELMCNLCKISTTCVEQLQNHLSGQKHLKKLRQQLDSNDSLRQNQVYHDPSQQQHLQQTAVPNELYFMAPQLMAPPPPPPPLPHYEHSVSGGGLVSKGQTSELDLSKYRTPSGRLYCSVCNWSIRSVSMFTDHLKSNKHARQVMSKK